ncbi:MAG: hemerythrin family protein [Syntrophaceae bacterium]|nr:hemerythrin family protein [Syntrophaceae bacterium]
MHVTWTPALSVGIEEIDNQHKELLHRVGVFFEKLRAGGGPGEIPGLFGFLERYVQTHFSLEEQYMTKFYTEDGGYAEERVHRAEHRAFARDFAAFREEILDNGPSPLLVAEFQRWIANWLVGHIGKTDRALGRYLSAALPPLKRR